MSDLIHLNNRVVIKVSGEDSKTFLQGLITNDINKSSSDNLIYALMLTPQGKFLYDFFIFKIDASSNEYFIDVNKDKKDEIIKKLSLYKLRSDVEITANNNQTEIFSSNVEIKDSSCFIDPRSKNLGYRVYSNNVNVHDLKNSLSDYEKIRIQNLVPDGNNDMLCGEAYPLDFNMNQYNGIDYNKGCYVGQEVTARVHHKGAPKKKPYLIKAEKNIPISNIRSEIINQEGKKLGTVTSISENFALGLLRIDETYSSNDVVKIGNISAAIQELQN